MTQQLTDEQRAALEPGVRLIEAGPGAGKTLTVAARFRQRAVDGRGVALLSFTNRAIDVARSRCRDTPSLLEPPHFIGTFDQFLHRFVTTPEILRRFRQRPQYVASWRDLTHDLRRIRPGKSDDGFELTDFLVDDEGRQVLDVDRLSWKARQLWTRLSPAHQRWVTTQAHRRLGRLREAHVYDCDGARRLAFEILSVPDNVYLRRLAARFDEVIVDELQDCNQVDHDLLRLLRHAGLHVVGVADPDQAIYDFRRPQASLSVDPYLAYRGSLAAHEIAPLTICHRSTPVICDLVSSLRAISQDRVVSGDDPPSGSNVVHVVIGNDATAGITAMQVMRDLGIKPENTWILAATRRQARSISQRSPDSTSGGTAGAALLSALNQLRLRESAHVRAKSIFDVETFMLRMLDWPADEVLHTRAEQLDRLELSTEDLRIAALRLVFASKTWDDKDSCTRSLKSIMSTFASPLPLGLVANYGTKAQIRTTAWSEWVSSMPGSEVNDLSRVRSSHIHGVKGEEFEAVILSLVAQRRGGDHALQDWDDGRDSEQRRVLYVGASRAQRCLVLLTPPSKKAQVLHLLRRSGVAFEVYSTST